MREMRRTRKVARRPELESREPQQARKERVRVRRPPTRMVRFSVERLGEGERYSITSSHSPTKVMRSPVMKTRRLMILLQR